MTNQERNGFIAGLSAFVIWGVIPIYFKAVETVSALEILAHRVAWSVPIVVIIMLALKRPFPKNLFQDKKTLGILMLTSLLISVNWYVFTWAATNDRVLETSLGYFINPLLSVALGMIFLKEKLNTWSKIALGLALCGVLYRIISFGGLPWVSLMLAFTFGFYGLLRKQVNMGPLQGLLVETCMVLPLTAGYIGYLVWNGEGAFLHQSAQIDWLLVAGGVVTTVPLALFAAGARALPLNTMGFLQYVAPSLTFMLAIFAFDEPFNSDLMITFGLIWLGLVVYTVGKFKSKKQ